MPTNQTNVSYISVPTVATRLPRVSFKKQPLSRQPRPVSYMSVFSLCFYTMCMQCVQRAEIFLESPGAAVTEGCEPFYECWK